MIVSRLLAPSLFILAAVACDNAVSDSSSQSEQKSTTADDVAIGQTQVDTGNANADVKPTEPTAKATSTGEFTLALGTTTPVVGLSDTVTVDVTVTPANGFTGAVDLSVAGLSAGVTATTATVTLDGTNASTATLTLSTTATADVTAVDTNVALTVNAASGETARATAPASFKVAPKITISIPVNVAALYQAAGGPLRAEWNEAFGPNNKPMHTQAGNGIVVTMYNADSKAHIVHGPGGQFPHGDISHPIPPETFEMQNGVVRTRTLNVGYAGQPYVHGEPNSQNAAFKIVVAAVVPPVTQTTTTTTTP